MKNEKIGIIGHFGGNEIILDGQTIKTKILYEELKKTTDWNIITVDTYFKKSKPFKLITDTIKCLISTNKIVVLLSGNGMKFYFPLLAFCTKVLRTKVYHDVIGGNLDSYVSKYPRFRKYLNDFCVNWVETNSMKTSLEKQGVNNCEVIPNFKRLKIVDISESYYSQPYCFCIFSRVMKEKGIEIAINAIESINAEAQKTICKLDIYGRIDTDYKDTFSSLLKESSDAIAYKGMVPFDKSVDVIKNYYALLFPTYWQGEGFPGTIVDAFSAGLPVIASDWSCNKEIINHLENGILYPRGQIECLKDAIEWAIANQTKMNEFRKKCIEAAREYQPDKYISTIVKRMRDE